MNTIKPLFTTGVRVFVGLSLITGLAYPLAVTGLSQLLFPQQAAGSLLTHNGQVLGSRLIGQDFQNPAHFWGRPSATAQSPYNAQSSGGSNLGPSNDALRAAVAERSARLRASDPDNTRPIPQDLLTASGSGLDPQVSPDAALWQAGRVARASGVPESTIMALIATHTERPALGPAVVNVLELNLALDTLKKA